MRCHSRLKVAREFQGRNSGEEFPSGQPLLYTGPLLLTGRAGRGRL